MKLFRHIVNSAAAVGVTAQKPPRGEYAALKSAVLFNGLKSVFRAGRVIPAAGLFKRRYIFLIRSY